MSDNMKVSVLDRLGRAVRELIEPVRRDTIPERWTELLERLNAEEDAQHGRGQRYG